GQQSGADFRIYPNLAASGGEVSGEVDLSEDALDDITEIIEATTFEMDEDEFADAVVEALPGVQVVDLSLVSVNTRDIFVLVESPTGLVNEAKKRINRSDAEDFFSVDFRND